MMKSEFETMTGVVVSAEEYERIETVYMYHPLMGPDSKAKAKIVEFYEAGLIPDLYPRALSIQKREETLAEAMASDREARQTMDRKIKEAEQEYDAHFSYYSATVSLLKGEIAELQRVRI